MVSSGTGDCWRGGFMRLLQMVSEKLKNIEMRVFARSRNQKYCLLMI